VVDGDPTTAGNQAGWQVVAGTDGTDLLEKVNDGAGHHFLLVGNGGYATIQAAVDAAVSGDTILVGPGTFAGANINKELTIIGSGSGVGGTTITTGVNQYGFDVTGNVDATAGDGQATVTIQGFKFTGNQVGVHVSSTTVLDRLLVQNSDFAGNTIHGVGTGSGAPTVDRIDILDSTFEQNGNGSQNGDGDIVLFGFTGNSLIQNVTIAGGANAVPTNANADTAIQINGRDPSSYDVTHPIGNVVFDNVHVTGSYAKVLVYIQGYTDLDGLSFAGNGNSFTGHAGWGWALAIDPTADETSSATPGVPGEPGFFDAVAANALGPDTVDLSHVTVSNDIPINVASNHPLFALNGQALGTVFSGTPAIDNVTGTDGVDLFLTRGGNDIIHAGGGNDAILYTVGDGVDTIDGGTGTDTLFVSGTAGNDTVHAVVNGSGVISSIEGMAPTAVELFKVDAGSGTDTLDYTGTTSAVTVNLAASTATGFASAAGFENVTGGTGNDSLIGDANANTLTGGAGDDTLSGGMGADTMIGAAGNDTYVVDNAGDVVTEALNGGIDLVQSSISYTLGANVENLTLTDAASNTQTFDDMALGAIADGENGWKVLGPARDQAVVNVAGSNNAFHISSDIVSGDFGGPYSPALSVAAGESAVSAYQSQSIAFDVKAVSSTVDGSRLEIDFANAAGTDRNNFLVIESTGSGLRIAVNEPLANVNGDWANNNFVAFTGNRTLVSGIDQSVSHHLEMRLTYVDGPNNDRIDIYLDGAFIGSTTTFENYRDFHLGQDHATAIAANLTDRVLFRTGDAGQPHDGPGGLNQGFNIDNVTTAVYNNTSATGNDDANVITGNSGDNVISGLGGADTLHGGAGNDTLIGGLGNDIITGDAGNDLIKYVVGDGADTIDGGTGFDTLDYTGTTSAVTVNLATGSATGIASMTGIENVTGGSGNDTLTGDAGVNVLTGGAGNDTLDGGAGADTMVGGIGDDTYSVDNTGDVVTEALNEGTDTVQSSASYTLGANVENLRLTGTANVDGTGNALDNVITGNSGNNTLDGGTGADTMRGGAGNDTYIVDNAGDAVIETSAANGTDTVLSSVTFNLGAFVENLTLTGGDPINGGGNGDANVITGNGGANVLTGGGGNDTLVGGAGTDTAAYSAAITTASVTSDGAGHFVVAAGGSEGTDTLSGIEKIDGAGTANILLVGNGGYATIQAAIAAATTGDTIMIAAGTYNENVVIDKGVTLVGLGNVTIHGTFESDNGIAPGTNVSDWLTTATSYSGAAGNGVTIAANNVALSNINIDGFLYGVRFASDVSNTTLTNVDVSNSVIGIEKSTDADINGLTMTGGSFTDGYIGIDFAKDAAVGQAGNGLATNVTISGTHFEDMTAKGIYVEALSNALITGVSMDHVGFFGTGPASGGPGLAAGVGIEVNLKNGVYHDITITDFDLTDTGTAPHDNSAAISVKTRDDAPSYNGTPATWTGGDLVISNGTIAGTTTGVRTGETGKTVAGPGVDVTGVTISNALHDANNGDVENVSQSVLTVEGTSGADTYSASPQSTGSIVFHGGAGVDTLTGGGGNDTFKYVVGDGADVIDGGSGSDTLDFTGTASAVEVDLGAQQATGIGTMTSIENVIGGSAGDILTGGIEDNKFTGGGGNDTITGGGGNDTAVYTTTLLFTDVVFTPGEGWSVNGGVAGGNDNLEDIAFVEHSGGRYVLIDKPAGTFGFANEDDAVAAGAGTRPGDTFVYAEVPPSIEITLVTDEDLEFTIPYNDVPTEVHITGSGTAHVTTGSGDDFIATGSGNDTIHTGGGNDVVQAGGGDDGIVGGEGGGDDIYDGGPGINTVSYPSATHSVLIDLNLQDRFPQSTLGGTTIGALLGGVQPVPYDPHLPVGYAEGEDIGTDVLINIQNATGGQGNDIIIGNDQANVLDGGTGGNDTINAGGGDDIINYTVSVGGGVDIIDGGADTDTLVISGTADDDTIHVVTSGSTITSIEGMTPTNVESYTLKGLGNGANGDTLDYTGTTTSVTVDLGAGTATGFGLIVGIENVIGSSVGDSLTGDSGNNRLDGGAGADTMVGGLGNDTYVVDNVGDVVTENANEGNDTVLSSLADYTLAANVENLTLTGTGNINGTGNGDANVITGNSGNNRLDGGIGADTLIGGDGNDTYVVDNIGDVVTEAGTGIDTVESSISYTLGANLENLTLTGSAVSGTGNGGANIITGNADDNTLTGGGGNDTLFGGAGTDTAVYTGSLTAASITTVADADPATVGSQAGWQVSAGTEGTDLLNGVEKISDGAGHNFLLVGNGGYATIQAAINAAVAGDTIMLAAGTYNENIVLDRAVTIMGANHGVMGTGTRGAESVITGGFEITGSGAVIDGVKITGGAPAFGSTDAIHVSAANATITNSVLQGLGVADTFGLETENGAGITGLTISNNLIDGWNDGVSLGQGTEAAISGNTLQNMANLALRLDGPAATTSVTGNFFINNSGPGGHIGVGVLDGNLDLGAIIGVNTLDASGGRIGIFADDDAAQTITGTQFSDFMSDNSTGGQAQTFNGGGGDDIIIGGAGNDIINGGVGSDTAVYSGQRAQYQLTQNPDGSIHVADLRGGTPDGADDVSNVEFLQFSDQTINAGGIVNHAPVATASDRALSKGQTVNASSLFTASDVDGNSLLYFFYDNTAAATSGHFTVNGVVQAAGATFALTAAQLAQTTFTAGAAGSSDDLFVNVWDGIAFSGPQEFHVNVSPNHAPTVTAPDFSAAKGQTVAASSLFSANDADGDNLLYFFYDNTAGAGSGHFTVNGVEQAAGTTFAVTAAQLAQTTFTAGTGSSDDLFVNVYDGTTFSGPKEFHVNLPVNHAPTATAPDFSASNGQVVNASSLFSANDADGDNLLYFFYDNSGAPTSGHFEVNGVVQAAGTTFAVTQAQLAQTTFHAGATSDDLFVNVYDGTTFSGPKEFHVNVPANQAPTVSAPDFSASKGQVVNASDLFSANDANGDSLLYFFYDNSADPASGHFTVNGVVQAAGTTFAVTAAQLAQTTFTAGTGSSDDLFVNVHDGSAFSGPKEFHVNIPANQAPTVTVTAPSSATSGQVLDASSLFTANDADGDSLLYFFYDNSAAASSGHFEVNGQVQAAGTTFAVTQAQLAQTTFVAGTTGDDLFVNVWDHAAFSGPKEFHIDIA
jgi:Ca2+-binding RTX toxin-like protein